MAMNGKRPNTRRHGPVAVLDIGTSKTACFVARIDEAGEPHVVGVGQRPTKGVRAGAVIDVEAVRDTVVNVVHLAEEMAGETIRHVTVNLSAGAPHSESFPVEVTIDGHEVGSADVRRVLQQGRQVQTAPNRELVHSIPAGFRVDRQRGIRDPRGLFGETLGVDMHIVLAEAGPVRTLATVLAGAHLDVEAFVVSPLASALSSLVPDEHELGATVIDMGAGVTSIAVCEGGEMIYTAAVPIGGGHVTSDIAHGLSTPIAQAERMKTAYGRALSESGDKDELIDVPQLGMSEREAPNHMPRSVLTGIIQPRLEETFELARTRLDEAGFTGGPARRVVLTGGASQIPRVRDLAARILDRNVRLGRPRRLYGLAEAATGPAFATCAGLLEYAVRPNGEAAAKFITTHEEKRGVLGRIGSWFHEHL